MSLLGFGVVLFVLDDEESRSNNMYVDLYAFETILDLLLLKEGREISSSFSIIYMMKKK